MFLLFPPRRGGRHVRPGESGHDATVFVVDDDAGVCDAVSSLVETVGLNVESFSSAEAFLSGAHDRSIGCIVLDIRMAGMDGLELQDHLKHHGVELPIIFITGHGDIPMAVQTLKKGAFDFIEKPFRNQALLDSIKQAIRASAQRLEHLTRQKRIRERLETLTSREKEVVELLAHGLSNKDIARRLDVSVRTVETHRANAIHKLDVGTSAEIIRFFSDAERDQSAPGPSFGMGGP